MQSVHKTVAINKTDVPSHEPTPNLQTVFPPTTVLQKPAGATSSYLLQLRAGLCLAGGVQGHRDPPGEPV